MCAQLIASPYIASMPSTSKSGILLYIIMNCIRLGDLGGKLIEAQYGYVSVWRRALDALQTAWISASFQGHSFLVLFVSTVLIILLLESKNLSEIQSVDMFRQISTLLVAFPAFSFSQLPTLGPTLWIHTCTWPKISHLEVWSNLIWLIFWQRPNGGYQSILYPGWQNLAAFRRGQKWSWKF